MNTLDIYLQYELTMLMDLLREYKGTFSVNEKGDWVACIWGTQYQGCAWDSHAFRAAYCHFIAKLK